MKSLNISTAALFLVLSHQVEAGTTLIPSREVMPSEPVDCSSLKYDIGLGAAYGQYSASIPGIPKVSDYVLSGRCDLDLRMGSYWMDNRYELLETNLASLGRFRSLMGSERTLIPQLIVFGGFGYGYQTNQIDISGNELSFGGSELLVNAGLLWQGSPFLMKLEYVHCVSRSLDARYKLTRVSISEQHIGSLEASLGFKLNQNVVTQMTVETEIGGGAVIEKDWVVAFKISRTF